MSATVASRMGSFLRRYRAASAGNRGCRTSTASWKRDSLVYAPPFSTVADTDLRARKAPSPRVWIRGSGAINNIEIDMTFDG